LATVTLSGINKYYGDVQALFDVSLDIDDGEFTVFVGPSGCGKSTLLRCIAGLESVSEGEIRIADINVTKIAPSDRDVAMVFQTYALYPHMSVMANMEFGMKVNGVPATERQARVEKAADILQLTPYLTRKPGELSGGQRQRVAIGRAIVKNPKVFLFDEPLSNLDAKLRVQMRIELESLHKQLGATMIYVTHDQIEAMTMADKIVVLRDGVIEQVGKPLDLYHHPRTEFVASFLGSPSMNLLDVEIEGNTIVAGKTLLTHYHSQAAIKRCGIRPEHLKATRTASTGLQATIAVKESLGGEAFLYCKLTDTGSDIVVKTDGEDDYVVGEIIYLSFAENRLHFFNAEGLAETIQ